jgi:hypothetical protein
MVHFFNPSTQEAEEGVLQSQGDPGQRCKTLAQNKQKSD